MLGLTCRVRWHNRDRLEEFEGKRAYVLAMWHNCSTIAGWAIRNSEITVMVSESRDGEYVSRLANLFGIKTIRGSSSAGTSRAIRDGLKILGKNQPLGVTPDGPRGPRYKMQSGTLWFAASKKVPIIPIHIESSRQWVLRSWDGHRFPKPFSTIHIGIGEPMLVRRSELETDISTAVAKVERGMMENVRSVQLASQQFGKVDEAYFS